MTGCDEKLDLKSVTMSHNVTAEELDRLPKARSFQGIALAAPGVNSGEIEAGFQVHGASGAENAFIVDGVVTNSLIDGRTRQNTVFEYLQEVQVKTSGINAEYGGALGGVISAVTKSGGNTFLGEGHYYYIGNGLSAARSAHPAEPGRLNTVGYLQDDKQEDNQNEIGGSIGGPIVRNGSSSSDRSRRASSGATTIPVLQRHRAGLDRSGADALAGVRQAHLRRRPGARRTSACS